jgi:hypothetical protein
MDKARLGESEWVAFVKELIDLRSDVLKVPCEDAVFELAKLPNEVRLVSNVNGDPTLACRSSNVSAKVIRYGVSVNYRQLVECDTNLLQTFDGPVKFDKLCLLGGNLYDCLDSLFVLKERFFDRIRAFIADAAQLSQSWEVVLD